MERSYNEIEELLPGYLSGELSDANREMIDAWRKESSENEILFQDSLKAWEAMSLLQEMEQFNSFEALNKINTRISQQKNTPWWTYAQKIAAILLLPLMIYSGYISIRNSALKSQQEEQVMMQTISSRPGMVTQFELADGTKVWLNAGSTLQFPTRFQADLRAVKLTGEAYFQVTKNEHQPFRVQAKELNIEVLGTSFNVESYEEEKQAEVVLIEGKVRLSCETAQGKKTFGTMHPNQRVVYTQENHNVQAQEVKVDKYIAWREGNLIFRDDKMEDVVKRLSRWFNVEIVIDDPEINNYEYKATFRNETLTQVLNLLKISAPIDYQITGNQMLPNGEYTKQKVSLRKKKI
ncbi:MAG TPA: FecR domain-containing protein [Prolixibacteraceae bacterium]|jgi:ferric-dicitrate binding protein FerR (iron transport regulator)